MKAKWHATRTETAALASQAIALTSRLTARQQQHSSPNMVTANAFEKFLIVEYTQGQREDRRVNFWIDFKHIHTEKYERGVKD